MEVFHPHISHKLFETILTLTMATHKDTVLFNEDPHEFEQRQTDFFTVILNP
jgi:hypothetical protein